MADRYWVGGSGNWNSTTKWSATSGGASGASVPTSADNAIFNASSGSGAVHYTVNVTDSSTCANLTFTPVAADGVTQFSFGTGFVIAGTFSTSGTAGNRRAWFYSSVNGLLRDMQIATIGTVTDVDFRDVRVTGAGGTLSGTRIGDLKGNLNITFSAAKTVYWNLAGAQNWSANGWAATSTGTPSTDNFPLAQDTATFTNAGSVTGLITFDAAVPYTGSFDASGRTSAMSLVNSTNFSFYGNWTFGSGVTLNAGAGFTAGGRNTQTITSAGKNFEGNLIVDSYGGTVQLADALNLGTNNLTVTNGTFDTKNYNVTAGSWLNTSSNVRVVNLGSSTLTFSSTTSVNLGGLSTNLTLNAGTSQITSTATAPTFSGGSNTFYNVTFSAIGVGSTATLNGANTFNNLSITSNASAGVVILTINETQTITGTLTCAGASVVRRVLLRSGVQGTPRILTAATLSANDCDFRDITIAGAAAGGSPTRAGDCGGNTGVTFPVAKTVYWNLAGAQNWSATGWATGSAGTPAINNFPLAQDTAVFDNAGSVTGTITVDANWNIGTFDASLRTSAMTLTASSASTVYGNWLFGTGVSPSSNPNTITFSGRGTQTITSNGVSFGCLVAVDCGTGTIQLADALTLIAGRGFTLSSGTFDAVSYNFTADAFSNISVATLKMGSGTWTLSGTAGIWSFSSSSVLYKGTANIVFSDTTTTGRTFTGGGFSYNKLTIGGATGTSTTTITGDNQFTEIASTKTVAHTIALGTTTQTFGAWTVTGTVGNVVSVSGAATLSIVGARVSGVDYLAMGSVAISATSPGEFYAGANSTGTGTGVILTAAPAATTRYWVGGTGTWDATTTTKWSTLSGGSGGASVPTSADAVVFDTLSNATGYTVTCTATQLRCAALTFTGPATGSVTWAGTAPLAIHGNFTLPATGLTRTYTGVITFSGSSTGRTITTNGITLGANSIINGVGCGWTLGSALSDGGAGGTLTVTNGAFDTANYAFTYGAFASSNSNTRSITLGSSACTVQGLLVGFTNPINLTFNAGTSSISCTSASTFNGGGLTFYNVSFTNTATGTQTLSGVNTFNNLSFTGLTGAGLKVVSVTANQTINGTLTFSAGTDATMRAFVQSALVNALLGTTRTLTCAAFAGTDVDFRDITIAGAAAPVSGTRLGDCKGNSGITFGAGVTRYWNLAAGGNWSATGWAASSGASPAVNNFPLAQDTCLFEATGLTSGNTVTVNAAYNIGTINMSARTTNTMTLATGTTTPSIYGNWINGTGTTLSGTGIMTFCGRGSQTITSAAVTFTQRFTINTPGGSVTLQDAYTSSATSLFTVTSGTFNASNYNFTLSAGGFSSSAAASSPGVLATRTVAIGSGTWTIGGNGASAWTTSESAELTITGTGIISLTSGSAKTFTNGNASYSGITINQGGAGTLTITGSSSRPNLFANISNTYKATGATTINIGTSTLTVGTFTASGEVGRVLTLQGTSSTNPGALIYTGSGQATSSTTNYLTITGVRAYSLVTTWYAGANSTNNGSLGWYFSAGPVPSTIYYGSANVTQIYYGSTPVSAIYYGSARVF